MIEDLNTNPAIGYLGNPYIKRDGISQKFTAEEIIEYQKCMADPGYFAEKYVKVINLNRGLVPFKLYPYQRKMFKHFRENRFSIVLACRQSGKSISSVIYLLWYAIFHPEKMIVILANKGSTAREMLSRVTLALENLPFFLQPGCKSANKGNIKFSNNSTILAASTSSNSIRGLSVNLLFLDEFAFVNNAAEFYTSTYPVISSGESTQVIITSTANGVGNLFYRLWEGSVQQANLYRHMRVDWWDVPGRDEKWKAETIANTSPIQFEQEFGNSFLGNSNTLVSPEALLTLMAADPVEYRNSVRYYAVPAEGRKYVMAVDPAKGRGQDFSTFTVIDITQKPFTQVATYRDNLISPLIFPGIIVQVAKMYNDAIVLIENNNGGEVVANGVYYEYEYENTFVESTVKSGGVGVNMTSKVKRIGCSNLKDLIETYNLVIVDADCILELSCFEVSGSSYEASDDNHDDLVMNLVLFSWFVSSAAFGDVSNIDLTNMLYSERLREMEEDVPSFGIIESYEPALSPEFEALKAQREAWCL